MGILLCVLYKSLIFKKTKNKKRLKSLLTCYPVVLLPEIVIVCYFSLMFFVRHCISAHVPLF
uniref:Uncharacterized protein n=6 Tax=Cercopithecidae TaxID=9527 RepID=A0A2K5XJP7_MANLE|nr:unnamed protein product [Macaca fascicularis]